MYPWSMDCNSESIFWSAFIYYIQVLYFIAPGLGGENEHPF